MMMKQLTRAHRIALAAAAVCVAAGVGRAGWRARQSAPEAALGAIPPPARATLADQEIARWREAARRQPRNADAWVNLGDALMQKARETSDESYYGHAERVYRQALGLDAGAVGAITGMAWVCGGRHEFEESVRWAKRAL